MSSCQHLAKWLPRSRQIQISKKSSWYLANTPCYINPAKHAGARNVPQVYLERRYGRKAKCLKIDVDCSRTLKESQGHSESVTVIVIECHQGIPFGSYESIDIQSPRQRLSSNVIKVLLVKSRFQGVLRNEKRDSSEKREKKTTLCRRQGPKN
jgi:hypothetical protein